MKEDSISQNAGSGSPTIGASEWNAFMSYSHNDSVMAERIEMTLENAGIKVWRDRNQIFAGENFVRKIEGGLTSSRAFILLLSPNSVQSNWITDEYTSALTLSNEPANPIVIIPVLLKGAQDEDVPPLLRATQRVDLRDESKFDDHIKELIKGIKREPVPIPASPVRGKAAPPFIGQISFLGFFPEGLLPPAFDHLVSRLRVGGAVASARREGVIRDTHIEGIQMTGAETGMIRTLLDNISDQRALARETLTIIQQWIADTQIFDSTRRRLGVGRSLLVRDLLILAGHLSDDDGNDPALREQVVGYARQFLPKIIEENLRIAVEISKTLMDATSFSSADYLMHARLFLRVGLAEQALEIFDSYGSDNLFADAGLDLQTRIYVIQDWAKAVKDSGQASQMHTKLVEAYDQILIDVQGMILDCEDTKQLEQWEADIRNDRATQLAVYGDAADWIDAQSEIEHAAAIYQSLCLTGELLATRANFVSHSLDHFKRLGSPPPTAADLKKLLDSLDSLEAVAKASQPDEDLFFFFYQKARLVKRLYPNNPKRAIDCYNSAADVAAAPSSAQGPRLPHRFPIARRWALKLSYQALLISPEVYLKGLRECADLLKQSSEDAWAAHALYATLLDLTMILKFKDVPRSTWDAARETFGVAARLYRRSQSSSSRLRLTEILQLMSDLNPGDELRNAFLQETDTNHLLGLLVEAPGFRHLNWEDISHWLKRQEE